MIDAKDLQPENGYQLPAQAYYCEDWYEKEIDTLFASGWNYLCVTDDLSESGSYFSSTIGRYPIVVVRGEDGEIRAFHNLCRHRGARVMDGQGTCKNMTCPYHRWQYGLDGQLKNIPQQPSQIPAVNLNDWNLKAAPIGIWMGMVFVNPDGKAGPFDKWLADLPEHLNEFKADELTEIAADEYEFQANWKFYIENHIDWYHLWYTHPRTLANLDHNSGRLYQCGKHWVSFEKYKDGMDDPPFKELDYLSEDAKENGAHLVFPNLTLFTGSSWFATGLVRPVSPTRAVMDFRIRALPGQDASVFLAGFKQVTQHEDAEVAERMQSAVRSPEFAVGPMTRDYELPIVNFHDNYLAVMNESCG